MKWAIFIPRFLPELVGGNTVYVARFCLELIKNNEEVHLFTTTRDSNLPVSENWSGVFLHRVFVKKGDSGPLRYASANLLTTYFNHVDECQKFDIVNTHSCFMLNYSTIRSNLKIVHTLHANATYEYIYKVKKLVSTFDTSSIALKEIIIFPLKLPICYLREYSSLNKAKKIFVMSNYVKNNLLNYFQLSKDKVYVSRIGVNHTLFLKADDLEQIFKIRNSFNLNNDDLLFLTVRRLTHRMGLENLICAFKQFIDICQDRKCKLLIVGQGYLYGKLQKMICENDLAEQISMLGYISDEKLIDLYKCVNAFILPTEELEGFGIVSLEAFSCNLPVIATSAGANAEVVGSVNPKLLTLGTDKNAIADKLIYYYQNRVLLDSYPYREKVIELFSWEKIVKEILDNINSIV